MSRTSRLPTDVNSGGRELTRRPLPTRACAIAEDEGGDGANLLEGEGEQSRVRSFVVRQSAALTHHNQPQIVLQHVFGHGGRTQRRK